LLCQVHGVGRYTAMLIIAEIGDVRRFPPAAALRPGRTHPNGAQP
jgi:transposase